MGNDLKKEKVKKILASIEQSAYNLIDDGVQHDAMDLVMDLTMMAYELDLLTGFSTKQPDSNPEQQLSDNVISFTRKDDK